jgi:hypothetical protein
MQAGLFLHDSFLTYILYELLLRNLNEKGTQKELATRQQRGFSLLPQEFRLLGWAYPSVGVIDPVRKLLLRQLRPHESVHGQTAPLE